MPAKMLKLSAFLCDCERRARYSLTSARIELKISIDQLDRVPAALGPLRERRTHKEGEKPLLDKLLKMQFIPTKRYCPPYIRLHSILTIVVQQKSQYQHNILEL